MTHTMVHCSDLLAHKNAESALETCCNRLLNLQKALDEEYVLAKIT